MFRNIMIRSLLTSSLALGAFAMTGCDNPTKDKPKAEVAAPAAETKAAVTGAETLALATDGTIGFVGSKITGSHEGGFKTFKGTIDLVPATLTASKVTVEIDTDSLFTDSDQLTKHLKSGDFFDVEKFPKATFTSTEIKAGGANGATHTIVGNLDLHGEKKSITFPATIAVDGAQVTAKAEFAISRKDFNLTYPGKPDDLIKDEVLIKFNVKAPRSAAKPLSRFSSLRLFFRNR